ncbi:gamma-glutamyltransferase [Schlesneria paludicola]|uniref:gamma-glutamyltransferase n=1 Tax=Schlesneria paludicola TaxID=360056 RepID=UPI00029A1955|nr:gamma-glutamyltransferase [Schlesneria paludicola]
MIHRRQRKLTCLLVNLTVVLFLQATGHGDELPKHGLNAVSDRGMVVSVSRDASEVGQRVLDAGGNAVDAAVAVGFALAVTWPEAGNIGGGGFMLVHPPQGQAPAMFDYRECAPAAATVDMFATGDESQYRLVGVPGTVRGLELAHRRFGRLKWAALVRPAVELARDGFVVSQELAQSLNTVLAANRDNGELQRVLGKDGGSRPWQQGDHLVQPDLAKTLQRIAEQGSPGFYEGPTADAIEQEMRRGGGLITKADLAAYEAKERTPVRGTYRGFDIYASAPPSSGGIVLLEMLNAVEGFQLRREGRWSAKTLHVMVEAMRRAYCDRARYLGDPDFNTIPEFLTSKEYGAKLAESISLTRATPSAEWGADIYLPAENEHTTHYSIVDHDGMAVSNTYTLEDEFGSRIVVRGAGLLLNNEMGDFNPKPGVTNAKGLIGTKPNLVAPAKRMLSSMCPVIVSKDGRAVLVTGSPGGRTIINTLFCVIMNVLEFEMPLREAVDAPRMHHPWMPDTLRIEERLQKEHHSELQRLREMGHSIEEPPKRQGDAHSIFISRDTGKRLGVGDLRRHGWAAGQ